MSEKRITLKTISKIAGVSIGTVSEALNDSPRISEKTKASIRKIAKYHNYCPNSQAKALMTQKSNTIGFILDYYQNYTNHKGCIQMMLGAMNVGSIQGYNTLMTVTPENNNIIDWGLDLYFSKKVDGLLFYGVRPNNPHIEYLNEKKAPYVILSGSVSDNRIVTVTSDSHQAAYSLVDYLIQKGHRKIAHISGSDVSYGGIDRREGFFDALKNNGIKVDESLIITNSYTVQGGYDGLQTILERADDCTAIFCGSDEIALGCCKYLHEHGMVEGIDMDVVGCNSARTFSECMPFIPNLTTSDTDYLDLGMIATRMLLRWIQEGQLKERKILIDSKFIQGSTA